MPRKSKSSKPSKKRKSSKTPKLKSSENASGSKTIDVAKPDPDGGATSSTQAENFNLENSSPDKLLNKIYVTYDSSFEIDKIASSNESLDPENELQNSVKNEPECPERLTSFENSNLHESLYKSAISFLTSKLVELRTKAEVMPTMSADCTDSFMTSESLKPQLKSELSELFLKTTSVETPVKPKFGDLPERAESVIPIMSSNCQGIPMRSESTESLWRSKSVELPVEFKLIDSLSKTLSIPTVTSELKDEILEEIFTQFTITRQPQFSHLYDMAKNILDYMKLLGKVRKDEQNNKPFTSNRWKQRDSDGWFSLLRLWDSVQTSFKMLRAVLRYTYDNFETENPNILITTEDFYDLVKDLVTIFKHIGQLVRLSANCFYKFNRFCASTKDNIFLKNVNSFRRNIVHFQKKLKVEVVKFATLSHITTLPCDEENCLLIALNS